MSQEVKLDLTVALSPTLSTLPQGTYSTLRIRGDLQEMTNQQSKVTHKQSVSELSNQRQVNKTQQVCQMEYKYTNANMGTNV
jgi:hypothetical protein